MYQTWECTATIFFSKAKKMPQGMREYYFSGEPIVNHFVLSITDWNPQIFTWQSICMAFRWMQGSLKLLRHYTSVSLQARPLDISGPKHTFTVTL